MNLKKPAKQQLLCPFLPLYILTASTLALANPNEESVLNQTGVGLLQKYMETLSEALDSKKAGKLEKAEYLLNQVNAGIRNSFRTGRIISVGRSCPMVIDTGVREIQLACLPQLDTQAVNPISGVAKKIDFAFQFGYATESYPLTSTNSWTNVSVLKRIQKFNKLGKRFIGRIMVVNGKGDLGVSPVGRLFIEKGLQVQSARIYAKILNVDPVP